jgi:hypothetical protein
MYYSKKLLERGGGMNKFNLKMLLAVDKTPT